MDYRHLNNNLPTLGEGTSDAWQRALSRLGDYTALVVRASNLRPEAAIFYGQTEFHLLVRLSTPGEHLILRIAPEDDLAAHAFFTRTMTLQVLPSARIIQRDLSRTLVPFAYTLESFVPGIRATELTAPHLLRGAGRQAGRALRRMHRISAPGVGRPNPAGRWSQRRWVAVLQQLGEELAPPPTDTLLFNEAERGTVAALLADTQLEIVQPTLMHGDFGPAAVRCTSGPHVHLEALVEPGRYVGGDGLFDLACGLCAAFPQPWRDGLLDGYTVAGPLSEAERLRLPRLRLLAAYWVACRRYMRAQPHEAAHAEALRLIAELVAT